MAARPPWDGGWPPWDGGWPPWDGGWAALGWLSGTTRSRRARRACCREQRWYRLTCRGRSLLQDWSCRRALWRRGNHLVGAHLFADPRSNTPAPPGSAVRTFAVLARRSIAVPGAGTPADGWAP